MDSYSSRGSTLFTSFTTVLFTFAALSHVTYYFYHPSPTGSIQLSTGGSIEFTEYKQYKADQIKFDFDLSLDLTSEYNWNVNQLYVFVVATYETPKNPKNEIIVYDKILRDLKDYKINLKKVKNAYMLRDEYKGQLAGKTVTLKVRYQVMPIFGLLHVKEVPGITTKFTIPKEYKK